MLMLSLIAFAVQAPTVTVSFSPMQMSKALVILSKATGQKLAASSALSEEIVVASLKDAPAGEVVKNIADVFLAKWDERRDGTSYLVPDLPARRRLEAEEARLQLEAMRPSFEYIAKQLALQPVEMDESAVRIYKSKLQAAEAKQKAAEAAGDQTNNFIPGSLRNQSPAWRALARILPVIGPETMLQIGLMTSEVWAEKPTHIQHSMPGNADSVLATYRRELALVDPSMNVARVKIAVKRWFDGSFYFARLVALDAAGKSVDGALIRIAYPADPYNRSAGDNAKPLPGEKPLQISEPCLDARIALAVQLKDPSRPSIVRAWRPKLEDPIHQEPATWFHGADVRTVAETLGKNLIGSVADTASGAFWEPDQVTPSQFLAQNATEFLPSKDGWLLFRNHDHVTPVPRNEGQALIRRCLDRGGLTVDDASQQSDKNSDTYPFYNWLGDYLHALFPYIGRYSMLGTTDPIPLRLWDSLGEQARTRLRSGATVNLATLPSDAKDRITRLIMFDGGNDPDPTDTMPDGITGGTMTLKIVEQPIFYGWRAAEGPPITPDPLNAKMLGRWLASSDPGFAAAGTWDTFRVGVNREYLMQFTVQPGSYPMQMSLSETLFDPAQQTISRLPEAIQKEVDAAKAAEAAKPKPSQDKGVIPPTGS